jgi:hypothetical protein
MDKFFYRLLTPRLFSAVAVLLFIGTPALTQAQVDQSNQLLAAYSFPALHITKLEAKQNNSIVSGKFTVRNSEKDAFGNLQYQILFMGPAPKLIPGKVVFDNAPIYDRHIVEQKFDIAGQSEKILDFSYTIPKVAAGEYRVRLQILTTKGVELGWNDYNATVAATESSNPQVELGMGGITIDKKAIDAAELDGVNVGPTKEITLNYFVQNNSKQEFQAVPVLNIWEFAKNRPLIATTKGTPVTIKKGQNRFSFPVVTASKPEAYAVELILENPTGSTQISNILEYRWVVTGPSAEISTIRVVKPVFTKGEILSANVEVVGSADRKTIVKAQLALDVLSGSTVIASNKSDFVELNSRPKSYDVSVGLASDVTNPTIRVRVIDEKGTVLDEDSSQITGSPKSSQVTPSKTGNTNSKTSRTTLIILGVAILILAIVLIIVFVIIFKGKKNPTLIATFLILSVAAFSLLTSSQPAKGAPASPKPTTGFTCNPPLLSSSNAHTRSPINCSGYSFGAWTSRYECEWHNGFEVLYEPWCAGDVLYPESRLFLNNPDLDYSTATTTTNGQYLVPVSGTLRTVACGNRSTTSYMLKASVSDKPTDFSYLAFGHLYRGGFCGDSPCYLNLGGWTYTAAFNANRSTFTNPVGQIFFDVADTFCGGDSCDLEHRFTEKLTLNINFPVPLTCSVPAKIIYGETVKFTATGGIATDDFNWYTDETMDSAITPSQLNTEKGSVLSVDPIDAGQFKVIVEQHGQNSTCIANVTNPEAIMQVTSKDSGATAIPITTGSINFGSVTGGTTVTKEITVTNIGDADSQLKITGIAITDVNTSPFNLTSLPTLPQTRTKNGFVKFNLQFSPTNTTNSKTLRISAVDEKTSATLDQIFSLSGTYVKPATPPTVTLTVKTASDPVAKTPITVVKGSDVTLVWTVKDADTTCNASSTPTSTWTGSPVCTIGTREQTVENIQNTTTFYINYGGNISQAKVNVLEPVPGTNIREI